MSKYSRRFNENAAEATGKGAEGPAVISTGSSSSTGDGGARHRLERRRRGAGSDGGSSGPVGGAAESSPPSSELPSPGEDVGDGERRVLASEAGTTPTGESAAPHQENEEEKDDDDLDDEADIDDAVSRAAAEEEEGGDDSDGTSLSGAATPQHTEGELRQRLYACDQCPHLVFYSADALEQHAIDHHSEIFPDFVQLRSVSSKLVPLWDQVRTRKAAAVRMWGRKVFRVARQRDAGPAKLEEAHRAREQLEHVVRRWHANARVFIFGSSVAFGVWDGMSDIDFTVVDVDELAAGTWPPQEKNAVRSITELLRRAGFSYVNLEPIPYARVPIIKHHASSPIRVSRLALAAAGSDSDSGRGKEEGEAASGKELTEEEREEASKLEAEDVVSRSVRYVLSSPASRYDRVVLEGSIRDAVGSDAVQQVWWNRTGEMMCITCDTTLSAIKAATCGLSFVTPGMRARVQPLHDECRPELYNVDFDLSFRAFGIRNSELLSRYLTAHPCARPGALVLKDWSKASGVNNSVSGYLTSYAVNIMWIYFLVQKGLIPYVDPILDVPASLAGRTSFGPTYSPMLPDNLSPEELEKLYGEAGELLLGFFFYYAHEFDWQRNVVSLNRKGVTTKRMLGWDQEDIAPAKAQAEGGGGHHGKATVGVTAGRRGGGGSVHYTFCIEDPYEENLNLGRHMGITKALRVQTELHRGLLSLLKDGENDSCVFASTDRTEAAMQRRAEVQQRQQQQRVVGDGAEAAETASSPSPSGLLLSSSSLSPPGRLPMKVLYKLMGISIQEMAHAKRAALDGKLRQEQRGSTHEEPSSPLTFDGLPQGVLEAAFRAKAPLEYQLACKAWNWQQLVHRLGYKLHHGRVLPRREIGLHRLSHNPQPPRGVVAASSSLFPSPPPSQTSGNTATAAAAAGAAGASVGLMPNLSERMAAALTEGFLRLTPEWVAWSKPWAALHLRGHTFFTPGARPQEDSVGAATAATGAAHTPPPPPPPASPTTAAAPTGPVKPTQQRRMRWIGPRALAMRPTAPSRLLKALLHK